MSTNRYEPPHLMINAYTLNNDKQMDLGPVEYDIHFPEKKTEIELHCRLPTTRYLPELLKVFQKQTPFVVALGNPLRTRAKTPDGTQTTYLKQGFRCSST